MFFKKSKKEEDAVVKRGIKKMDALITGAVLGGVVASLYGVKKLKNMNEEKKMEENEAVQNEEKEEKRSLFGKLFR